MEPASEQTELLEEGGAIRGVFENPEKGGFSVFIAKYAPYMDDLWHRLYRSVLVFCVAFVVGFFGAQAVVSHLLAAFRVPHVTIIAISPFQFIDLSVDVAFCAAFFFATPFFVWNVCRFVRPAVSRRELFVISAVLFLSLVLFIIGFLYGAFALYAGLSTMAILNLSIGLQNYWDVGAYLSVILTTATLLGVLFQFPLIVVLLARIGAIDRLFLVRHRRVAYALIVILVALLPPTDGLSLIIMSVPLIILYEATVWMSMLITAKKPNLV